MGTISMAAFYVPQQNRPADAAIASDDKASKKVKPHDVCSSEDRNKGSSWSARNTAGARKRPDRRASKTGGFPVIITINKKPWRSIGVRDNADTQNTVRAGAAPIRRRAKIKNPPVSSKAAHRNRKHFPVPVVRFH
jgi:hypothetical protein